ncbi:hypothetical protein FRC14_003322 [Serendipita sp. 396]|nr:hypothetical protein FRC14_003322 [Serendipita sp. 396]KAG8783103.1 hypothetical protein FRC15_005785 [Serendipita sp. 397]KAG8800135.1 hypothetical protein FRC16_003522 [Serendipita sp. 398]KAG8828826.1 hypothetical protein FRC19_000214 [Serendipita sp. 401]KAG8845756.1 hypothetical protein FRB91_001519 [Serendipita sp. 411]KAG8867630.1 hypothetical protein FRC20_005287 [Serendipita sp. 405]KAG9058651.1 hypothetical protein FS842_005988 [Serendipita sp. 407]
MRGSLNALSKASRRPLTSKMANKDYYKGTRQGSLPGGPTTGPPGRHNSRGNYILDDRKVRVFICPPPVILQSTPLRPFVDREALLSERDERKSLGAWKALRGRNYLRILSQEQKEDAREVVRKMRPVPEPTE